MRRSREVGGSTMRRISYVPPSPIAPGTLYEAVVRLPSHASTSAFLRGRVVSGTTSLAATLSCLSK
jgi:hypothetical protein